MQVTFELPYPPSANRYWRNVKGRTIISEEALNYRSCVYSIASGSTKFSSGDELSVHVATYPPDNRKRDLDNSLKIIFDSLEKAGVYENDFQIGKIVAERMEVSKPGKVMITVSDAPFERELSDEFNDTLRELKLQMYEMMRMIDEMTREK